MYQYATNVPIDKYLIQNIKKTLVMPELFC